MSSDMAAALKERGHYLYVRNLRRVLSRRKNADGTRVYQGVLDKLTKWNKQQLKTGRWKRNS